MHQLPHSYTFWALDNQSTAAHTHATTWNQLVTKLASFQSIEDFWSAYNYINRPNQLPTHTDIHLFKHNIIPVWEDIHHQFGGKITIRIKKQYASLCFENLVIAFISGEFQKDVAQGISGINISIKNNEHVLSVWVQDANNVALIDKLKLDVLRILEIPVSFSNLIVFKRFFD
jgi:translation initiation factor 4E